MLPHETTSFPEAFCCRALLRCWSLPIPWNWNTRSAWLKSRTRAGGFSGFFVASEDHQFLNCFLILQIFLWPSCDLPVTFLWPCNRARTGFGDAAFPKTWRYRWGGDESAGAAKGIPSLDHLEGHGKPTQPVNARCKRSCRLQIFTPNAG